MLELQKAQRQNPTPAEEVLWRVLRGGNLERVRFLRQKVFGRYIVDFYCASAKLVIELDGEVHDTIQAQAYNAMRTEILEARITRQ
jgi:very-short-patch-repair endonuclease